MKKHDFSKFPENLSEKYERIFVYISVVLKVPGIDRSRDFIIKNAQELCLPPPESGDRVGNAT